MFRECATAYFFGPRKKKDSLRDLYFMGPSNADNRYTNKPRDVLGIGQPFLHDFTGDFFFSSAFEFMVIRYDEIRMTMVTLKGPKMNPIFSRNLYRKIFEEVALRIRTFGPPLKF